MWARSTAYRVLVGKPEGKRPLGKSRHRWQDNIKPTLEEENGMLWTGLIWLRIGNSGGIL
jgi:hypothetical protein